ncbi:nuclear transcription factor y subunit b-8, partial [Phtheirospermum japonicum]
ESPCGGSYESGGDQSPHSRVREQDRFLPIANIARIMNKGLPANGKIAKDSKETVQECVWSLLASSPAKQVISARERKERQTMGVIYYGLWQL